MMLRIVGPAFCCGVILDKGVAERTAPIVGYMQGWSLHRISSYVKKRGWTMTCLSERD